MICCNPMQLVPSGFVVNLISLNVFNLLNMWLYSIPTYLGQRRIVEFLTSSHLPIRNLAEKICHICRLQVFNISYYEQLESFPYKLDILKIGHRKWRIAWEKYHLEKRFEIPQEFIFEIMSSLSPRSSREKKTKW